MPRSPSTRPRSRRCPTIRDRTWRWRRSPARGAAADAVEILTSAIDALGADGQRPWRLEIELGLAHAALGQDEQAIAVLEGALGYLTTRHGLDLPPEGAVPLAELHEKHDNRGRALDLYNLLASGSDVANHFLYYRSAARLCASSTARARRVACYSARASSPLTTRSCGRRSRVSSPTFPNAGDRRGFWAGPRPGCEWSARSAAVWCAIPPAAAGVLQCGIRRAWTGTLLGRDLGEQSRSVSKHSASTNARVTVQTLRAMTSRSERIVMVTAYDATFARMLDEGGADILLVGDSLGMVVQGHDTTLPVTMDEMLYHCRAVARGTRARARGRRHAVHELSGLARGGARERRALPRPRAACTRSSSRAAPT